MKVPQALGVSNREKRGLEELAGGGGDLPGRICYEAGIVLLRSRPDQPSSTAVARSAVDFFPDDDVTMCAVAPEIDQSGSVAGFVAGLDSLFGVADAFPVDLEDDIAFTEAGLVGIAIGVDSVNHGAFDLLGDVELTAGLGGEVGHAHATEGAFVVGRAG